MTIGKEELHYQGDLFLRRLPQSYALDNTCVPGQDRSFVDESPNYKKLLYLRRIIDETDYDN